MPVSVQLKPNQAPPSDYYRSNLIEVCDHVARAYADVLTRKERQWLQALLDAEVPAQRLFARLLMRKGPYFRLEGLCYDEVGATDCAVQNLSELGLASVNSATAPADALLALLKKTELEALTRLRGRKTELVQDLLGRYTDARLRQILQPVCSWVRLEGLHTAGKIQLLYFGRPHRDFSAFVLRDLGLVQYEKYEFEPSLAPFADAEAVAEYERLTRLRTLLDHVDEYPDRVSMLLERVAANAAQFAHHRTIARLRYRLLNELGRRAERRQRPDLASACYRQSGHHPARERLVRLYTKSGDAEAAQRLLEDMRTEPWSVVEADFAERFGQRRGRTNVPVTRLKLPDPQMDMRPGAIEKVALECLADDGAWGVHIENHFAMGLTGLACWPVIFAAVSGAFSNPMQTAPNDLFWDDFATTRKEQIDRSLERLRQNPEVLRDTWRSKLGLANRLVAWTVWSEDLLNKVITCMPPEQLVALVRHVICDLANARTGFPDLFVIHADGTCEFVEVKGPNDALQPQQRAWFRTFKAIGCSARVMKFDA